MSIFPSVENSRLKVSSSAIDFSRYFMPEKLTTLYYTEVYTNLTDIQRLRYNQLHGLYFNEQTIFFEKTLAQNVLGYFLQSPLPGNLKTGLKQFLREELEHTAMFRKLNRLCDPGKYADQDFYFLQVPTLAFKVLDVLSRRPQWFPFLLWLMHLQEERSLFFGKTFLGSADLLEPHFVSVQRQHLADETGHVGWDEELLDWVWPETNGLLRLANVQLLGWMMKEYFTMPKRSAIRVVEVLVGEFPELRSQLPEICLQLRSLGKNQVYLSALYCTENVPKTFRRFDLSREFSSLTSAIPGYVSRRNS
jgi:hypothetical protein